MSSLQLSAARVCIVLFAAVALESSGLLVVHQVDSVASVSQPCPQCAGCDATQLNLLLRRARNGIGDGAGGRAQQQERHAIQCPPKKKCSCNCKCNPGQPLVPPPPPPVFPIPPPVYVPPPPPPAIPQPYWGAYLPPVGPKMPPLFGIGSYNPGPPIPTLEPAKPLKGSAPTLPDPLPEPPVLGKDIPTLPPEYFGVMR
eukprot:gnl/TRDRNA2_/TRDRNA2_179372_c0_seq1.p1 gnl/TRDRNA2_/TRDRNA2_179372_c0~~gnl/TRDRNA2_/TRDRNA2_179372_c0_seq1.p1  ORF type:complete len:199 (+),score=27.29 gnl/TRDRNA2_/TRDRNA2_179372_c0_seq1:140-736(+)